ncbi:fibrohexamerin-like, partial [Hyposmocoma kahamanoa]|uniref:fibrohexamerin-like n=1 Tax=Hyposmocoma kahamanoa TaxID=1477025 RepID=UPI000E6D8646
IDLWQNGSVQNVWYFVNGSIKQENDDDDGDGEYIGDPDDHAIIERPCEIYDIYCIRKYFANHAKCTIRNGPLPDPDYRTQTNYYIPRANASQILTEIKITGFNQTRVEEFYINKKTNKLIIALNFRNILLDIPSTYAKFYRRGREPIVTFVTRAYVEIFFTITIIIPNADDLQLDKAEMTAFIDAAAFLTSPTVFIPPDVQEVQSFVSVLANFPAISNEIAMSESYYYGSTYIQSNICDFGLKVF